MNDNLTELVFILDRSGSMQGLADDTIGGYNSLLAKEKALPGRALVTTVLFDDRYELLHDRVALTLAPPLTEREYFARGNTALLDAVGRTITGTMAAQANASPALRPDRVLFVIITDGLENASREYNGQQVRQLIEEQKRSGWEFIFLGANMDAVTTAAAYGIDQDHAVRYEADGQGIGSCFKAVHQAARCMRTAPAANAPLSADWKAQVEADYASRGDQDE